MIFPSSRLSNIFIFATTNLTMKKIIFLAVVSYFQIFVHAQETIDFEFNYPENSQFTVEQKINNAGIMKINGTPQEIAAIKKAGYNQIRKLDYYNVYETEFKTFSKKLDSFPFEFSFVNVLSEIDSDGKKKKSEMSFKEDIIKGDLINGKLTVIKLADTGSKEKDQYINSLPVYFIFDFPIVNNMKIGDSFISRRNLEKSKEGYKVEIEQKYTLTKIENSHSYFSISINIKNDKKSSLKSYGTGSGEMVYEFKDKYIESEKTTTNMTSETMVGAMKMTATNTIISSYKLLRK